MSTQEIRILAEISVQVPIELSKKELNKKFNLARVAIDDFNYNKFYSHLEVIDIETEEEIYETDED